MCSYVSHVTLTSCQPIPFAVGRFPSEAGWSAWFPFLQKKILDCRKSATAYSRLEISRKFTTHVGLMHVNLHRYITSSRRCDLEIWNNGCRPRCRSPFLNAVQNHEVHFR
ncbi:hypothetical protein AVEN_262150-1 [Araneus ventricosus]|uniref:Uncharacterized protein n=1 Tax=Araneus ventricosus TaxID=182803 RepID=A0A4Y2EJH5_ARAVE|nr:hypothetical protein AVEN_262150-1 [Araneus ventricosus]